jgi:hypothetical protein
MRAKGDLAERLANLAKGVAILETIREIIIEQNAHARELVSLRVELSALREQIERERRPINAVSDKAALKPSTQAAPAKRARGRTTR